VSSLNDWRPDSWKTKPVQQQPAYADPVRLSESLERIRSLPPLVPAEEVERLKSRLAEVAKGERFFIQAGDCSERFDECRGATIEAKVKIILQAGLILLNASKLKLTLLGRLAGQYAKPRSRLIETRGEISLPAYQGDLVNRPGFTPEERAPDPGRLIEGYLLAGLTLSHIRALLAGDLASVRHPYYWDVGFADSSPEAEAYRAEIAGLLDSVRFMEAVSGEPLGRVKPVEFYSSHEGLLLGYEEACVRRQTHRGGWYAQGAHFLWIGERTRALDGAHIEFFRGLSNPIGVKVGPSMKPDELVALIKLLNPGNEPGRLTLIHRMGAARIEEALPPLVREVRRSGRSVVWCCDPMHGNTVGTPEGAKTRSFDDILDELRKAFAIHREQGTFLGGLHFELTGENVTECIGGARGLSAAELRHDYRSLVDPRLNHEQTLEMALQAGRAMRRTDSGKPVDA
jgi:3-deoxy-7-phosphoheptulonate synthase